MKVTTVSTVTIELTGTEAERLQTMLAYQSAGFDEEMGDVPKKFVAEIKHELEQALEKSDVKWMDDDGDMCA